MTEKQYQILLNRIKRDLYNEFINPETAHFGMKYIDEPENNDVIYEGIMSEKDILQTELGRLCTLQNKYIENEDYEKAEILKNRIIKLQIKINKL